MRWSVNFGIECQGLKGLVNIPELFADLTFWEEVAPDGAELYIEAFNQPFWLKWVDGVEYQYSYDCGNWFKSKPQWTKERYNLSLLVTKHKRHAFKPEVRRV